MSTVHFFIFLHTILLIFRISKGAAGGLTIFAMIV